MTNDNTPQESGKPFAELPQVPRFPVPSSPISMSN